MPLDPKSVAADAYMFGPIENKQPAQDYWPSVDPQRRTPGSGKQVDPPRFFCGLTMIGPHFRLWRLARSISYVDDDWRWLQGALEWDCWHRLGCDTSFTQWLGGDEVAEVLRNADGPEFNIFGPDASQLIERFRASKRDYIRARDNYHRAVARARERCAELAELGLLPAEDETSER